MPLNLQDIVKLQSLKDALRKRSKGDITITIDGQTSGLGDEASVFEAIEDMPKPEIAVRPGEVEQADAEEDVVVNDTAAQLDALMTRMEFMQAEIDFLSSQSLAVESNMIDAITESEIAIPQYFYQPLEDETSSSTTKQMFMVIQLREFDQDGAIVPLADITGTSEATIDSDHTLRWVMDHKRFHD